MIKSKYFEGWLLEIVRISAHVVQLNPTFLLYSCIFKEEWMEATASLIGQFFNWAPLNFQWESTIQNAKLDHIPWIQMNIALM